MYHVYVQSVLSYCVVAKDLGPVFKKIVSLKPTLSIEKSWFSPGD